MRSLRTLPIPTVPRVTRVTMIASPIARWVNPARWTRIRVVAMPTAMSVASVIRMMRFIVGCSFNR